MKGATGARGPTGQSGAAGAVSASVAALETRTDPLYGDLATPGPSVTLPTGTQAFVILTAQIFGSTGQTAGFMSVSVDGNDLGASDANSLRVFGNDPVRASATALITGLTPGPHTFKAVYRNVGSGTSTFSVRTITVIPG